MENKPKFCLIEEHNNCEIIRYCQVCDKYLCKKCENWHSKLFSNHKTHDPNQDMGNNFTGICKEKGHSELLKYFCKTHNVLCCASCITPIKHDNNGKHNSCELCLINEVKDEKKNKLDDNIKKLEELSLNIKESIEEIKKIYDKINISKENLKNKVQEIFTKIKIGISEREEEILQYIENKFDTLFFSENVLREYNKMPNKIKIFLEKGKKVGDEWNKNNNEMNSLINDCIVIENTIANINNLNQNMIAYKSINLKADFYLEQDLDEFLQSIKDFGKIIFNNFKFKKCPPNINSNREYKISGEDENIITKTGTDNNWMGTICENQIDKTKECVWKIKVLNTKNYEIMVGIANNNFNIKSSLYTDCGWYYYWRYNTFYSGAPHYYENKPASIGEHVNYNIKKTKNKIRQKNNLFNFEQQDYHQNLNENIQKIDFNDNINAENDFNNEINYKNDNINAENNYNEEINYKNDYLNNIQEGRYEDENNMMQIADDINEKMEQNNIEEPLLNVIGKEENIQNNEYQNIEIKKIKKERKEKDKQNKIIKEIIIILNYEKQKLQFMANNEILGEYNDIPIDKPLFPSIFLYNKNDSIAIEGFN